MEKSKTLNQDKYSYYFMKKSSYLRDCLVVTRKLEASERKQDGLTSDNIIMFIKYGNKTPAQKDINLLDFLKDCFSEDKDLYLRIASECMLGVYGDSHCDCENQRLEALNAINLHGQGIYIHLPQEAQGHGLHYKCKELELQVQGRNQEGQFIGEKSIDEAACMLLGKENTLDIRNYSILREIFEDLGLNKLTYCLLTGNEKKIDFFKNELNINITRIADIEAEITIQNIGEFLGKLYQKNNFISNESLEKMLKVIEDANQIPLRASNTAQFILEDLNNNREFNTDVTLLREVVAKLADNKQEQKLNFYEPRKIAKPDEIEVEYNKSFQVNSKIFEVLYEILGERYIHYSAFEINRYFGMVHSEIMEESGRELKIRTSYNIKGMESDCYTRLIYKIPVGGNEYKVVNTKMRKEFDIELMNANPMYKQIREQDVITHVCKLAEDLNALIKEYPGTGMFLEIKGEKNQALKLIEEIDKRYKLYEFDAENMMDHVGIINKFSESAKKQLISSAGYIYNRYGTHNQRSFIRYLTTNAFRSS